MDRKQYNQCMVKFISGSKPKEQRRLDFCIGAKVCSKGISEAEARQICSQPKPPKPVNGRRTRNPESCEKNARKVAECVVGHLQNNSIYRDYALNINSVGVAVTNVLMECQCGGQNG